MPVSSKARKSRRSRKQKTSPIKIRNINEDMTLSELKEIAKFEGVEFGGLRKTQLINKLKKYYNN